MNAAATGGAVTNWRKRSAAGWTGDNIAEFVRTEMHSLLLDDARLSVDHLAQILAKHGKKLPAA